MDTITHAIIGAAVARATSSKTHTKDTLPIKQRVIIGALAAAFPDIDYITALIHPLAFIAEWHRSITHSFIMLPLWAVIIGLLLSVIFRKNNYRKEIILISALSLFSHIITDLITSWGTQVFSPISDHPYAWGITFIIDPYFTGIILIALIISVIKNSRLIARTGIAILCTYMGLQVLLKSQAYTLADEYIDQQGWQAASVYVMPQPLSPFNWKIVLKHESQYYIAHTNLIADNVLHNPYHNDALLIKLSYLYKPSDQLDWKIYQHPEHIPTALASWNRPEFELYRKFAVLPYVYKQENNDEEQCNWFGDIRFLLPYMEPPFRYGMCMELKSSRWYLYRLHDSTTDQRELITAL